MQSQQTISTEYIMSANMYKCVCECVSSGIVKSKSYYSISVTKASHA